MMASIGKNRRTVGTGWIVVGALVLGASFIGGLSTIDWIWPRDVSGPRPVLAAMPPLPAAAHSSVVVAPTMIALSAVRETMEQAAPRDFTGKRENPLSELLAKADIGWTVTRGPISLAGRADALAISTDLSGKLRATGQIASEAANVGAAVAGLFDADFARNVQSLAGRSFDQRADVRGTVAVTARPTILPAWRLEPNLTAQVVIGDTTLSLAGIKLNVGTEVKPFVDRAVAEQMTLLQARLRDDPFMEVAARREWVKMCRAIALKGATAGAPDLWLEMRPVRAFAAQPKIDANAVTLTVGVQAETRIVTKEVKPSCPFPAQLEIVPPMDRGRLAIALPVDLPFTDVSRLLETRLKGRKFPEDESGPVEVTILGVSIAASGDRLLISLRVKAREKKSFFGFGADAMLYVWGRPVLDRDRQTLQLADLALDVESEAAFGLVGAAARAAMPFLRTALKEKTIVDLNSIVADARRSLEIALADVRKNEKDVRVDAAVTSLRLTGVEFDSHILRIVVEAEGTVNAAVNSLTLR